MYATNHHDDADVGALAAAKVVQDRSAIRPHRKGNARGDPKAAARAGNKREVTKSLSAYTPKSNTRNRILSTNCLKCGFLYSSLQRPRCARLLLARRGVVLTRAMLLGDV
eukprot:2696127-Rhodomonas_salina.1